MTIWIVYGKLSSERVTVAYQQSVPLPRRIWPGRTAQTTGLKGFIFCKYSGLGEQGPQFESDGVDFENTPTLPVFKCRTWRRQSSACKVKAYREDTISLWQAISSDTPLAGNGSHFTVVKWWVFSIRMDLDPFKIGLPLSTKDNY